MLRYPITPRQIKQLRLKYRWIQCVADEKNPEQLHLRARPDSKPPSKPPYKWEFIEPEPDTARGDTIELYVGQIIDLQEF